jgi:hypothetical protein
MNHDSSNSHSTHRQGAHRRAGGAAAVLVTVALMAAISFGSLEGEAPEPQAVGALVAQASTPPFVPVGEAAMLPSAGFPVECSQVPSGLDCLYY